MSRAITAAILFSKPSNRALENGRLFGSAQTRSSRLLAADTAASSSRPASTALRQPEDIERSSFGGCLFQIGHCIDEAQRGGAVTRVEVTGNDRAGPAADAGQHRDVL